MAIDIQFCYDFGSPNAYLSHLIIPQIEARNGCQFHYQPILLGGVFKLTSNAAPTVSFRDVKNKLAYFELETERFIRKHQISQFKRNPHFPVNTLQLMRGAVYMQSKEQACDYVEAMFHHMWVEPKKMDDRDVFHRALVESDLPADEIIEATSNGDVKKQLAEATHIAVERGVFGAPSFFLGDELFYGKDSLAALEEEIQSRQHAAT